MNEPYAEVGRVVTEAQFIEEAFRQILRANFTVAKRHLAAAQVDHYGQKPWTVGCPAIDAEGRQIVYKDERGFRFSLDRYYPEREHSHIRLFVGYQGKRFSVYAKPLIDTTEMLNEYSLQRDIRWVRVLGPAWIDDGWVVSDYEAGGPPLE